MEKSATVYGSDKRLACEQLFEKINETKVDRLTHKSADGLPAAILFLMEDMLGSPAPKSDSAVAPTPDTSAQPVQGAPETSPAAQKSSGGMAPAPSSPATTPAAAPADQGDDDLYAASPANDATQEASSAIATWQTQKDAEVAKADTDEQAADQKLRATAQDLLNGYYDKLKDAQTKKAAHNKEVEADVIASLNSSPENKWEHVVSLIDFNRSDLHKEDVSKMKGLLLRLKH